MNNKLIFSGHETFHCRHFWLKKGYDFVKAENRFSDPNAVVELGVGKNMVASIRFWLRAFGILDHKEKLTPFADYLFGDNGHDPYLENIGTVWLLHYFLVKTERASIYSLVFNEFRKERREFNRDHLSNFLIRKCEEMQLNISTNTLKKDISVFFKNYVRPIRKTTNIEDDFSSIFLDLDLVQELVVANGGGHSWYSIESLERSEIPKEIILFAILDRYGDRSTTSFQALLIDRNSVGSIFCMNASGLINKIEEMTGSYSDIVFSDDGGVKELQIKTTLDKWDVLNEYYGN